MSTRQLLLSAWEWEPSIVIGCIGLLVAYARAVRFRFTGQASYFAAGVLLILLALVSPLDALGDRYLFSAHMLQHLLLALVIPPLLILGLPAAVAKQILSVARFRRAERILRQPLLAWPIGIGAMAFWHVPAVFNVALVNPLLHVTQHLCFLVTGSIFWWPVFSPREESRMAPVPWSVMYLFTACFACTILGILMTFAPPGVYPAYLSPRDELGILALIRNDWEFTPKADQQAGGLLMWVLGCVLYVFGIMAMFARWFATPDKSMDKVQ